MATPMEIERQTRSPSLGCIFVVGSPILRPRHSLPRPRDRLPRSCDLSGRADNNALSPGRALSVWATGMEEQTTRYAGEKISSETFCTNFKEKDESSSDKREDENDIEEGEYKKDVASKSKTARITDNGSNSHRHAVQTTQMDEACRRQNNLSTVPDEENNRTEVHSSNSTEIQPSATEKFSPPDGGWGWVVCVTSLWVNGCVMGTVSSFGILYDFVRRQHAHDAQASFKTSFIGSCLLGVMLLMCCVSGILCDVIGLRQTAFIGGVLCVVGFASSAFVTELELLYVTYGVILGSGFGLLYSPLVAIAGHYFNRRLGLVNGIVTFGPSAFTMGLSFALPSLLKAVGLRNTLLGFAGIGVTIAIATLTWIPLVKDTKSEGERTASKSGGPVYKRCLLFVVGKVYNRELWRNKPFVVWCVAMAIGRFGYMEPHFHLVNHVRSLLPNVPASLLVTIMAGTSGISKLLFGLVSDLLRNYRIWLQQAALCAYGAILLFLPLCSHFPGFVVIAVCLGLADALIMVLYGPNVVDLVGPGRTSQAFGFMSLLSIPGFLSAPAITGRLHDHFHYYDPGFYLAGAVSVLASAVLLGVRKPGGSFRPPHQGHLGKRKRKDCEQGAETPRQQPRIFVTPADQAPTATNDDHVLECTKL